MRADIIHQSSRAMKPISKRSVADFVLRQDFYAFVRRVYETLHSDAFIPNWHIEVVCRELLEFLDGSYRHLVVNLPPRSLKSIIGSVALTAFLLGKNPAMKIICVSYAKPLADDLHRATAKVMSAPWYRRLFPHSRMVRCNDEGIFTSAGGCRRITSVGGSITGFGADLIILDDPIKPEDAISKVVREKANEWMRSTLLSRANDKRRSKTMLIQQRLHVDDPSSVLLKLPATRHLCLPAISDRDETFVLSSGRTHRWTHDEPLQDVREHLRVLRHERERVGDRVFQAQYLQAPVPAEGGMIKWSSFKTYDERPVLQPGDRHVFSWDTAFADSLSADYSACTEWLIRNGQYYLLNVVRAPLVYPDLKRKIRKQLESDSSAIVLIEDKGSGMSVAQDLTRDGLGVVKVGPEGSKELRASLASDQIEAGNVYLPRQAHWLADFQNECLAFPDSAHDDQVDSMSQAITWHQNKTWQRSRPIVGSY